MEMRSETFGNGDVTEIEWNDRYFKFCEFRDFSLEGQDISSDFVSCSFTGIDCYWVHFNTAELQPSV